MTACVDLEIGLSLAGLRNLQTYGIPDPIQWSYSPYSRIEIDGDGRPRGFGFPTASWTWDVLSQDQLAPLLDLFASDSDAAVLVYLWTYKDSGSGLGTMRGRFTAYAARPVDGLGKTMYAESRTPVYNDITLSFTHMQTA